MFGQANLTISQEAELAAQANRDVLLTKTQDQQAEISHLRVDLQQEKDQHRESNARSTTTALKGLLCPIMSVGGGTG